MNIIMSSVDENSASRQSTNSAISQSTFIKGGSGLKILKTSLIGTFLFINLALILFLWERNQLKIDNNEVPSIANANIHTNKREIITEKISSSRQGDYIVEKHESIEIWYDQKGNMIKRVPTGDHTYLRYWASKKGKIIMDDHDDE
jgi:hypothetical protein